MINSHTHTHTQTEETEEILKGKFCHISENVYDGTSSNYIQMFTGSLNVNIWKDEIYRGTRGMNSLHTKSSDNVSVLHTLQQAT
jgi:hypothetical protein